MRAAVWLVALLLLIGGASYYFGIQSPIHQDIKKGLDIKGGVRLVLQGESTPEAPVTRERMERALEIIRYRVDTMGVSEPVIQLEGSDRIIVELADVTDTAEAAKLIGKTAFLTFLSPDGEVVVTGEDLDRAAVTDDGYGGYAVSLQLKGAGIDKFTEATRTYLGQPIAIVIDDQIYSAPVVQNVIANGRAQITGNFSLQEAKQLSDILNGGALPVQLEIIENRSISATLGEESFARSVRAGLIGLALVAAFMVLFYRVPGFLAVFALLVYVLLTFSVLLSLNAVLTLPGLAGIILSLGMAVDANVVIFERIREEVRNGKSLRGALQTGFKRAFTAVVDANITTIIAAVVLYYLGTGPIKGFGLTLGIGVAMSLFTAVTFTRWLLILAVRTGWFGAPLLFGRPVGEVRS